MSLSEARRVLVVNPGSTSTKVAVFRDDVSERETLLGVERVPGATLWDEFPRRLEAIRSWLVEEGVSMGEVDVVVGRGGLLRPVEGGIYRVTQSMLSDARSDLQGTHASNLGCALARALADAAAAAGGREVEAYVVDPVSTDEFGLLARYSGLRELPRKSLSHALSIHALVREVCAREGRGVEGSSFVVAHLGGGISICPVRDGRILDANNANSGGPFSPSRAGGLPTQELLELAFSGTYSPSDLKAMTLKAGGLVSYLGTDDAKEVEARIRTGDREAETAYQAMAYQIAKEIGAMATVLEGGLQKILLTGGLAASDLFTDWIRVRVEFLGPVEVWPEVEEMRALALGGLRAFRGDEAAKEY
jgi:butyrate kinase